ncbi:hypothetical protein ACQP2T_27985 [Nonomuraea sp. CA-143628]|uniref:hypothetical protein n=1 Tax=Nonomuraea sp. CA-143628 TaxID=3239997 RepID=UPI003D8BA601
MTPVTKRRLAAAMWANRPSVSELMFFTIAVLVTYWLIAMPLVLLVVAVLLILVGGTLQMALADLRKTTPVPPAGEGDDAED